MRFLGGLETRGGWYFTAAHVARVANTPATDISRRGSPSTSANFRHFRPDVCWREQVLGRAGVDLRPGISAASTSTCQLRDHLDGLTRAVFDRGVPLTPSREGLDTYRSRSRNQSAFRHWLRLRRGVVAFRRVIR